MATDLQAERVPNNVRRFSQVSLPDWHGHILAPMTRPLGGSTSIMVPSSAATFRSRGAEILSRSQLGFAYLCAEVIQLLHLARHLSGTTTVMQPGDKLALQPVSCPVTWRISCPAAGQFFLVASCAWELCFGRFSAAASQRRATVSGLFAGRLCRLNLHFWRVLCCPEPVLTLIRGERPHAQVEWRSRDESFGFSVGTMR